MCLELRSDRMTGSNMCGIAGKWQLRNRVRNDELLAMQAALEHRGPDDRGLYRDRQNNVGLVHARLSIIDLSVLGHQPMSNDSETVFITYNGEVYNFAEVRESLEAVGQRFRSRSDTEVVLRAYEEWGLDCLSRFNGMFAFAIWDKRSQQLILVRDRVGVKPLYYYWDGETLAFASELKALMVLRDLPLRIEQSAVRQYLKWGYVPSPNAIFRNVRKVEPAQYVVLSIAGAPSISKHTYWAVEPRSHDAIVTSLRCQEDLLELLESSFKYRMVADVPVGLFLSGGIDSSLVTAVLSRRAKLPLCTFTIGFAEAQYDESRWARKIARHLETQHFEFICTAADAKEVIPLLPRIYDEPFGDSSAIPTYLVARFAREHVTVALSADGGDELFGGYRHHVRSLRLQRLSRVPGLLDAMRYLTGVTADYPLALELAARFLEANGVSAAYDRLRRVREILRDQNPLSSHYAWLTYWFDDEIQRLTGGVPDVRPTKAADEHDLLDMMLRVDFQLGLPDDMLTKVDRACMAVSLENRDPMLDHRLVEFAFRLPSSCKIHNGSSKAILRNILGTLLPSNLQNRKKMGFIVPLQDWCRGELSALYDRYLSPETLRASGLLDPELVAQYLCQYRQRGRVYAHKLWSLLMLQMWWEEWMNK